MSDSTYCCIGCGNIAKAICAGAFRSGTIDNQNITVYDADPAVQIAFCEKFGAKGADNAEEAARGADFVFIAVKPGVCAAVLSEIGGEVRKSGGMVISLAAGVTIAQLQGSLPEGVPVARVMPNLNMASRAGVAGICFNECAGREQRQRVRGFFELVGSVFEIAEPQFDILTAISGCAPAYTYMFIDALAKGAHKNGMNKALATRLAAETVLGSAKALLESAENGAHAYQLVDNVCSPAGMTIKGVCALDSGGFTGLVTSAVEASLKQ